MATLKTMIKLYDGYSDTIGKVSKKTDIAFDKILKASGATDKFNKELNETGVSANKASKGLGKFISAAALLATAVKGMGIADEYTNTAARLSLINDGLQTQAELQEKIFAAADRARGSYSDMSAAVAKMGLLGGDNFGSNDELIAFTELVQKGFRVGGASQGEQASAMLQLTQAMGAGRLQGDEFRSIMENAPMMADAIAKYMGKSKGELKELSAQGLITSDIIKNAMFMAGDDINAKFETMPMTFGTIWNKVKNSGLRAFGPVIEKVNELLNTDGFQRFINATTGGINLLAAGIGWLIDVTVQYWDIAGPILGAVGGYMLSGIIAKLWGMITPLVLQGGLWAMIQSPIFLVALAIGFVAAALNYAGVTAEQVFGFIGGSIGWMLGLLINAGITIQNSFIAIMGLIERVVYGAINNIIQGVNTIINALNMIPGVDIGSVSELNGYWGNKELTSYLNLSDMYDKGSNVGKGLYDIASDKYSDTFSLDTGDFGTGTNPLTIQGTGPGGKVDVDMSDEDLQYLRDIAERDYINKFSTATLAPNLTIQFGDVHEEADADKLAKRLQKIFKEQLALAAEGDY